MAKEKTIWREIMSEERINKVILWHLSNQEEQEMEKTKAVGWDVKEK